MKQSSFTNKANQMKKLSIKETVQLKRIIGLIEFCGFGGSGKNSLGNKGHVKLLNKILADIGQPKPDNNLPVA